MDLLIELRQRVRELVAIFAAFLGASIRLRTLEYLGRISYGLFVYQLACIFVVASLHPDSPVVRLLLDFALTVTVVQRLITSLRGRY